MQTLAQVLSTWDVVLAQLRRMSISWQGTPLSERDRNTFTEAIVMCCLHLLDLSPRYDDFVDELALRRWAHFVCTRDVGEFATFLSDAITLFRKGECSSVKEFKRSLPGVPVGDYLAPIRTLLGKFSQQRDPRGFYGIYQFLSFLTHVTLVDIELDTRTGYLELESHLSARSSLPESVRVMNSIMREWMEDFSISEENFDPHHGPGAIRELPRDAMSLRKYQYLGTDSLIDYVFRKHGGLDVTSYFANPVYQDWERVCKIVDVPKSMKTRRTISKEPATLMFLQQGVKEVLYDFIEKHPYLGKRINFAHQEWNAQLAIESSLTQEYSTIDLSNASDTVTLELVKAVFRGTPLYPFLIALRSTEAEFSRNDRVVLAKYAPMGSALCFPIETLIFACLAEYAVRRAHALNLGYHGYWRVYGDDIIVHRAVFDDMMLALKEYGFTPNPSKSFTFPCNFRESCGGEGYDGIDVTPMRLPRRWFSVEGDLTSRHAELYVGLMEMANTAFLYEFSLLRTWIMRILFSYSAAPPLFSQEGRGTVLSEVADNYRAARRVAWDYQTTQIRVARPRSSSRKEDLPADVERARYVETLRQISKRSGDVFYPDDAIHVPFGTRQLRLRSEWVDYPFEAHACLGLLKTQ